MNKLLKEAMDSLALVGIYTTDSYTIEQLKSMDKELRKDFQESARREKAFRENAQRLKKNDNSEYKFELEMAQSELKEQAKITEYLIKIGEEIEKLKKSTKDADTVSEYNAEIQRLTKKAEQLRKAGQGKSAIEVEKQIEKLGKEAHEYSKDADSDLITRLRNYGEKRQQIEREYNQKHEKLSKEYQQMLFNEKVSKSDLYKKSQELLNLENEKSRVLKEFDQKNKPTHDNDATENGAIKQFGQSKQTEVMPVEKKPILAQDDYKPDPKVIQILEDLRAHKLTPGAADKMLVQAGVPYVMAGLMVRKPEQYIPVNDEEPVYTLGTKDGQFKKVDELQKEINELKNKIFEKESELNGMLSDAPHPENKKYNPYRANIHKLKGRLEKAEKELTNLKSGGKMTKDKKTYQNGEHIKIKWGSREGDLIDVKVLKDLGDKVTVKAPNGNVVDVPKIYIKDTLDECMEVLRLSGFVTDAEPTWQDVYKYFTNASLQELEKLDSKDKVISFLLHKGAYGKFPKDKIDEAIRRFMDS